MDKYDVVKTVGKQLAIDMNCSESDFHSCEIIVTEAAKNPGRNMFGDCDRMLSGCCFGGSAVFSVNHELVEELTLLVEKKRRRRELQGDVVDAAPTAVVVAAAATGGEAESSEGEVAPPPPPPAAVQRQPIRSTYIQRRSKDTSVDVRIVEEDVNIKLTKRRRDGCLAAASRALDDLRLDLVHLSGGKIGDCHIYMFNTKVR